MYTVKRLAELANITVRTVHYYDQIGLLRPSQVGANGYRHYDAAALLRLQQILFYRELGLELLAIKTILDDPQFDVQAALHSHRNALQQQINRLQVLIDTVDNTLLHLEEGYSMGKKKLFKGFSDKQQKYYERQARLQYGPDIVNATIQRWNTYSEQEKQAVLEQNGAVYKAMVKAIKAEQAPDSPEVQALVARWQEALRYFYEPTWEIMRGLAQTYNSHPEFMANFKELHKDLPSFLEAAITHYVDALEHTELERLLAEDETQQNEQ